MQHKHWLTAAVIALALVGCSGQSAQKVEETTQTAGSAETPLTGTVHMDIEDFAYSPSSLTVKVGTQIVVENHDLAGHTVTFDDGSFDSPVLGKEKTTTLVMDKAGTFSIHCTPHPTIKGTITVVE